MNKTEKQTFIVAKQVKELKLHPLKAVEFRFLVNNNLWVVPPPNALNAIFTGPIKKGVNFTLVIK